MKRTLLASLIFATLSPLSYAQSLDFKFQSSDPADSNNFKAQASWARDVEQKSGGKINIKLLPSGSVVGHKETLDALSMGALDGHITDTSYFSNKDAAYSLIANPVGAWSAPSQMLDFIENGGGKELMNTLHKKYKVHFIGATTPGLEAFVSAIPIDKVDDLKGVRMRAPEGLVTEVFAAAGAKPINLPGSDVKNSLKAGIIKAADYTVFSSNHAQGMHDVAKHPIYPGFHSMPLVEISMSDRSWNKLTDEQKKIMSDSVRNFAKSLNEKNKQKDLESVKQAKNQGVTVHDWSDEERAKFRKIATQQWEKVAARSDNAKTVYKTLVTYLKEKGLLK